MIYLSSEELYTYFPVLLVSGYVKVPHRRLFWETRDDTHNLLISNAVTRNRFDIIHRFLHFSDNSEIDQTDRVFKVRPLIDYVNNKFQEFAQPLGSKYSLDEAMEPYYGRLSMKQFIRSKPIWFDFKFRCLATPEGYLQFCPYTGKKDRIQGESLGSSVVQSICIEFILVNSFVFIDNYFNSLELLNTMLQHNLNVTGTIRAVGLEMHR